MPPAAWAGNDGRCSERTGESASAAGSCATAMMAALQRDEPPDAPSNGVCGVPGQRLAEFNRPEAQQSHWGNRRSILGAKLASKLYHESRFLGLASFFEG